jgi:hypothetical protein
MLDVPVAEVVLQSPCVVAIIGELKTTGMAQHVWVDREWHLGRRRRRIFRVKPKAADQHEPRTELQKGDACNLKFIGLLGRVLIKRPAMSVFGQTGH